ncbi:MAG: hypothetical protein NZ108_04560, partial [Bacteroidia bacterium]|nr:hypothetical protein [Bacteroidia bacterium]
MILKNKLLFLWFSLLCLVLLAGYIVYFGYYDSFYYIYKYRNSFFDTIFPFFTYLGDGLVCASICTLYLSYTSEQNTLSKITLVLLHIIFFGLLVQLLKTTIFSEWDRPVMYWGSILPFSSEV